MADLVNDSAQAIADALAPSPQAPSARWRWGSVASVNADGTMNVSVGGATVPSIRCAQHVMGAQVGDRVRVLYCGTECMVDAVRATGAWTPWEPDVLYDNPVGDRGTIALSASAAGYGHMRIYYCSNDFTYGSVDVLEPDGKKVSLIQATPNTNGIPTYVKYKCVLISGTSISTWDGGRYSEVQTNANGLSTSNSNNLFITHVEAW